MKTKLLEQPIEETTLIKYDGIVEDSYKSYRDFESYVYSEAEANYKKALPYDEEAPESFIRDHSDETARVIIDSTSIKIDTDLVHCQNWWGVMSDIFKNAMVMIYIRDLTTAGYTVIGE